MTNQKCSCRSRKVRCFTLSFFGEGWGEAKKRRCKIGGIALAQTADYRQ